MRKFLFRAALFGALGALAAVPDLAANITNEGNNAVEIEIRLKSGQSRKTRLFPDQTIELPVEATEVIVSPSISRGRGDEKIEVAVVEPDGTEGTIEKMGGVYILGQAETAVVEPTVLKEGSVKNEGNIYVDIIITRTSGLSQTRRLYLEESVTLSEDTAEVQVAPNRGLRGDEIVKVDVVLPDGTEQTITSIGGRAKIELEEKLL